MFNQPAEVVIGATETSSRHTVVQLNSSTVTDFDRLTRLAARCLQAPAALIIIHDAGHMLIKSAVGLREPWGSQRMIAPSSSSYQQVIKLRQPLIVDNAQLPSPSATSVPSQFCGLTSYIGIPLITATGIILGALYAGDPVARRWKDGDLSALEDLATLAISEIELHNEIAERTRIEEALRESEIRYRSLFENSVDAVLLTAPDGRIFAANPEACRIFGRTEEEICNGGRHDLVDADDPRLAIMLEERSRTGRFCGELRMRRKDGTIFTGEIATSEFKDRKGEKRASLIIRDISERLRIEQGLRESEERFRRLSEATFEGIMLQHQGHIIDANRLLATMFGYDHDELLKAEALSLIAPQARESVMAKVASSYEEPYETLGIRKDGTIFPIEISGKSIPYYNRMVRVSALRDITERKRAELERERLIGVLNEALVNIKTLRGLLPICASCKKIRDDGGYWNRLETYIQERSEAEFTHGLCPDCTSWLYPGL